MLYVKKVPLTLSVGTSVPVHHQEEAALPNFFRDLFSCPVSPYRPEITPHYVFHTLISSKKRYRLETLQCDALSAKEMPWQASWRMMKIFLERCSRPTGRSRPERHSELHFEYSLFRIDPLDLTSSKTSNASSTKVQTLPRGSIHPCL